MNSLEHFGDPHSAFREPCHEVPGRRPEHNLLGKVFGMLRKSEPRADQHFRGNAQAQRPKDTALVHLHTL